MKNLFSAILVILAVVYSGCKQKTDPAQINWEEIADNSSRSFLKNYWNETENYFNYGNGGSKTDFHYWPQAHALDLLLDAYERSGDSLYLTYINQWYEGVPLKNGGSFLNLYVDDMEWNALAMLRAYQLTGDKKFIQAAELVWEDIKVNWNENAGGGLLWKKDDPHSRNACSNAPAAILAARLFREKKDFSDLEWAKKIYHWERKTLFDDQSGAVWDNIKETEEGLKINKEWIFTYNQGTFTGAAVELFSLTGDSSYLQDAVKAADYTLAHLIHPADNLLKSEGEGDGGLFKGIFIRYLKLLVQHHALDPDKKDSYTEFLFHNAQALWQKGTDKERMLYGHSWKHKPGEPVDLTVALSGSMLIEAAALLDKTGYLEAAVNNSFPVWSGNPVFEGWYADPEVIVYNDRYWIFPTYSAEFDRQVHFDCFSSPDLVNWTKYENIIDTAEVKWARRAMWAPGVIEKDSRYYFFFAANDVHEGEVGGIGVAVAGQPQGPYADLLKRPLINEIVNGAQPIDQFVFRDKDGSWYMFYGGWRHCNVVKLNADFTGIEPLPDGNLYREVTPEGYVEGPVVFIRNGKYYFMWSEGGWTGPDYRVAYAISDSLLGPFSRIGTVLQQDPQVATGAGHHSVLNIPGTDEWYIVYHRRPLTETSPHHRVTCIDRMEFDEEGKIKPVKITFHGVTPEKL